MQNLKRILQNRLEGAKRVAILGIGSDLRGDDVAGLLVAGRLDQALRRVDKKRKIKVFFGATAPENITGEIKKFKPTHLIVLDSANLKKKAGDVRLIEPNDIGGIAFSTHRLPNKIMIDYLRQYTGCEVIVIGIQPKVLDFGKPVSKAVENSAKKLSSVIQAALAKG